MISSFQFLSYKIHHVSLTCPRPSFQSLQGQIIDPEDTWKLRINVRDPWYLTKAKVYIGGLDCSLQLFDKGIPEEDRNSDNASLAIKVSISGLFGVDEGQFKKELEEQLVKVQIPAILFPYVRASVTALLANAGFGSVMLPLINMNEVGKNALKDKEIQIIEE